jgi:hypothetical protein
MEAPARRAGAKALKISVFGGAAQAVLIQDPLFPAAAQWKRRFAEVDRGIHAAR